MLKKEIRTINRKMKERYGFYPYCDNLPRFRVVWSEDQFEVIKGSETWYGAIFIKINPFAVRVKKYQFLKDRYILEVLQPNNEARTGIQAKYSYEPLFVFEDACGGYLEPILKAVNLLCYKALNPIKNYRNYEAEEQEALRRDIEFMEIYLENQSPYLASMLHNREAVVVSGRKQ
jgi:hypothetical protein